jgi:hypothetical protein
MCDLTVLNMPTNIDNLEPVEVFQRLGRARDRVLNSGIRTLGGRADQLNFFVDVLTHSLRLVWPPTPIVSPLMGVALANEPHATRRGRLCNTGAAS